MTALLSSVLLNYWNQICPYPAQQLYQRECTLRLHSLSVLDGFDLVGPLKQKKKTENPSTCEESCSTCTSNGVFQFTVFVPATTLEKCIYLERAKCLHIRNHLQKHLLSYFFIVFPAELQAQTPESLINVFRTHVLCEIPQRV